MRLPLPPSPVLSPDGKSAAVAFDRELALVTTRTGERLTLELPEPVQQIAFDPQGGGLAVIAGNQLAWLALESPVWPAVTIGLAGIPFRLSVDRDLAAVAVRSSERTMDLYGFRLEHGIYTPLDEAGGRPLGALAVYQLKLNAAARLVALRGLSGRHAHSGEGEPFVGLMALGPGYELLWKGGGLPFEAHNVLFPLAGGALGVSDRYSLARLSLADPRHPQLEDVRTWPSPLETVSLSPDGSLLVSMSGGDGNAVHIRSSTLDSAAAGVAHSFSLEGNFPALAIDNRGEVTVVWGSRPDLLHILRLVPEEETTNFAVVVPAEPDLRFAG